jgi:hypothetical protein
LFKLVLFDIRILILSIVLAGANVLIYGRDESTLFSVLLGLMLFLSVWVIWILVNLIFLLTTRISMGKDEKKQIIEMTSLLPEGDQRAQNGVLILTDQKLYFKTYFLSRQKANLAYALNEIKRVTIQNMGFIERSQMNVQTRSQAAYRFNVYSGKKWAEKLRHLNIKVDEVGK